MPAYIEVPVVPGFQGGHQFYVGAISVATLLSFVQYTDPKLPARERAQRVVSIPAAKGICDYITENLDSYHFSNFELAVLGDAHFEAIPGHPHGYLKWMDSTPVIVMDAQTRTMAFEMAVALNRAIAKGEDVKVSFEISPSLERCQQIASDLNLKQRRFSRALAQYFDARDPESVIARLTMERLPLFENLTEIENDTVKANSPYLFSYNGFFKANALLLQGQEHLDFEEQVDLAVEVWTAIAVQMPDWMAVNEKILTAKEARTGKIHSQAIVLEALGKLGAFLLKHYPKDWQDKLTGLDRVDWRRLAPHWEQRVIFGRTIKKDRLALLGIVSHLKSCLSLPLDEEEKQFEQDWQAATPKQAHRR